MNKNNMSAHHNSNKPSTKILTNAFESFKLLSLNDSLDESLDDLSDEQRTKRALTHNQTKGLKSFAFANSSIKTTLQNNKRLKGRLLESRLFKVMSLAGLSLTMALYSPFAIAATHEHEKIDDAHEHDAHEHDAHEHKTTNSSHENPKINATSHAERTHDSVIVPDSILNKTDIAVSNYPLYLLSEAVTKGAPSATLLLGAGDIGHHGSLSPSDMKTIVDSRYVIWFGDALEANLADPFAKNPNTIALFDINGFALKPHRQVDGKPIEGTLDPHMWLDPQNAKAITRALGAIYSHANPKYAEVYAQNVQDFAKRMNAAVDKVQKSRSSTAKPTPYWVYHDAFQYIEPTLNLSMIGALTTDHHLPPKASQFIWLNKNRPNPTMCMVLQSDSNKGVLDKLNPVNYTVQSEDMSQAKDFVTGWLEMAQAISQCNQE